MAEDVTLLLKAWGDGRREALDEMVPLVELKVFGGLKNDEIAGAIGVSRTTVKREWEAARAWLHRELSRT